MKIELSKISTDFNGEVCFTHARAVIKQDGFGVMTTQPLRLTGCDVFYGIYISTTRDGGKSWSALSPSKTLVRQSVGGGIEIAMCDATPIYHKASGKILLIGHNASYRNDEPIRYNRKTLYAVYDEALGDFSAFRAIEMPMSDTLYYSSGSGSSQYVELEGGDILIPFYHMNNNEVLDSWSNCYKSSVMRCSFDGESLSLLEIGEAVSVDVPRGLYEPSLSTLKGEYFLAMRNDVSGYVAKGRDGLHFERPLELVWDSGENVGNYCTQQHWITLGEKLYMVYTRRGADNDHVFRHRAPLFIAEFDTERMCLIKATEKVVVPNRGARLGNFGAQSRPDCHDGFVIASEWMQTTEPNQYDYKKCMKYGSDNSIFIAHIS